MAKKYLYLFVSIALATLVNTRLLAQFVVHNNGSQAYVRPGCLVTIKTGDMENAAGNFSNSGTVTVEGNVVNDANLNGGGTTGQFNVRGNWTNNGVFSADQTTVALNGNNQNVNGTVTSSFYNLTLQGTGIKALNINSAVSNQLNLNDRELSTLGNVMHVTNTATTAIAYTTGFVSGTGNGRLRWDMAGTGPYVFQVGSSVGTQRVRPIRLSPQSGNNSFAVRMANVNATTEGFNIGQAASELCIVNPLFYHLVDRVSGAALIDITQYYAPSQDGNWSVCAHWAAANQWQDMGSNIPGSSGLYSTVTRNGWSNFINPAFALSKNGPTVDLLGLPVSTCQNGSLVSLTTSPSGSVVSGPGILNGSFFPTLAGPGQHLVSSTFTDSNGCSGTDVDTVQVYVTPLVELNISGPPSFCSGDSIDISATPGFANYAWNSGPTNDTITVLQGGQYNVTATDANGCSATSANANITVYPLPAPVISANGPLEFCEGGSVLLTVGNLYTAYDWSNGAGTFTTLVTDPGQYTCTVTNQFLCTATSLPVDISIITGSTGTILDNGNTLWVEPAGSNYQWFLNGNPIPGATGQYYDAQESGNYTVEYDGPNACPSNSFILEFTYVSVDENQAFGQVSLFPNPGTGEFTIAANLSNPSDLILEVFDIIGRAVIPSMSFNHASIIRQNIDLRPFAKGVYMVRLKANEGEVVFRYIKD